MTFFTIVLDELQQAGERGQGGFRDALPGVGGELARLCSARFVAAGMECPRSRYVAEILVGQADEPGGAKSRAGFDIEGELAEVFRAARRDAERADANRLDFGIDPWLGFAQPGD